MLCRACVGNFFGDFKWKFLFVRRIRFYVLLLVGDKLFDAFFYICKMIFELCRISYENCMSLSDVKMFLLLKMYQISHGVDENKNFISKGFHLTISQKQSNLS